MTQEPDHAPRVAVAVAASAGGVEALTDFVRDLPIDFPGIVLVVLHVSESGPSVLPNILTRASKLSAQHAHEAEPLRSGVILVAPPGQHLRVRDSKAVLDRGPRENGHRPSADALLRSVAEVYGNRSAGVILSGTMDDGAAGLAAVGLAHGLTLVQDPAEAAFPGMPRAAIAAAGPDVVCRAQDMAARLVSWIDELAAEERIAAFDPVTADEEGGGAMSELSRFTCPECGGTLWQDRIYGTDRYHCRVGHAFSENSLLVGKQDALEAALWAAIVALEERAELSRRVLRRLEGRALPSRLDRYRDDIACTDSRIHDLRSLINELVAQGVITDTAEGADDADILEDRGAGPEEREAG